MPSVCVCNYSPEFAMMVDDRGEVVEEEVVVAAAEDLADLPMGATEAEVAAEGVPARPPGRPAGWSFESPSRRRACRPPRCRPASRR